MSYNRELSGRRGPLLWLVAGCGLLVLIALGSTPTSAVADDVIRSLNPNTTTAFATLRDPNEFVREMTIPMPRPVVPLSREDAVAAELLDRTKSLSEEQALRTAATIIDEADDMGHDPFMLLAVIHIESYYNHLAISPVGAEGLMQIMPYTAEWFAPKVGVDWSDRHSFDPVLNVRLGSRYLAMLREQFHGRMDWALTAYNRGPSATWYLLKHNGQLPTEIRDFYATKVLDKYRTLRRTYGHLSPG